MSNILPHFFGSNGLLCLAQGRGSINGTLNFYRNKWILTYPFVSIFHNAFARHRSSQSDSTTTTPALVSHTPLPPTPLPHSAVKHLPSPLHPTYRPLPNHWPLHRHRSRHKLILRRRLVQSPGRSLNPTNRATASRLRTSYSFTIPPAPGWWETLPRTRPARTPPELSSTSRD